MDVFNLNCVDVCLNCIMYPLDEAPGTYFINTHLEHLWLLKILKLF